MATNLLIFPPKLQKNSWSKRLHLAIDSKHSSIRPTISFTDTWKVPRCSRWWCWWPCWFKQMMRRPSLDRSALEILPNAAAQHGQCGLMPGRGSNGLWCTTCSWPLWSINTFCCLDHSGAMGCIWGVALWYGVWTASLCNKRQHFLLHQQ